MHHNKQRAEEMRRNGSSYHAISATLNIPKSTLSHWFSKEEWSLEIRVDLTESARITHASRIIALNAVRGERLREHYETARSEAIKDFQHYKDNPLFISGIMLYWGEGDKIGKDKVRLTNTDPSLIKVFVLFLTEVLQIPAEKVRAQVLVYPDLDERTTREYWIRESGLSDSNFLKSTPIQGKHKTRRLGYGVCIIHISSTYLKVKVLEWLRLLPKQLIELV